LLQLQVGSTKLSTPGGETLLASIECAVELATFSEP
jgi:hypothetical protein